MNRVEYVKENGSLNDKIKNKIKIKKKRIKKKRNETK